MSYEIVKALKIDTNKNEVWLKSSSNNVSPRTYDWWHCKSLSTILCEQGLEAVEKEILEQYWSGIFQGTNNLYEKSVQYYKNKLPYTWDNTGSQEEIGTEKYGSVILYSREQLQDALHQKYLEYKNRRKGCFYIKYNGHFVRQRRGRYIYFSTEPARAKRFNSREDATLYAENLGILPDTIWEG